MPLRFWLMIRLRGPSLRNGHYDALHELSRREKQYSTLLQRMQLFRSHRASFLALNLRDVWDVASPSRMWILPYQSCGRWVETTLHRGRGTLLRSLAFLKSLGFLVLSLLAFCFLSVVHSESLLGISCAPPGLVRLHACLSSKTRAGSGGWNLLNLR